MVAGTAVSQDTQWIGPMPSVVRRIRKMNHQPLISSGLISEKEDVYALIDAGATAISTTNQDVWFL